MPEPRVSVIILTYNRPHLIGRAIESVICQHFLDWEVVVVHDGPDELTSRAIEEWQDRDSRIRYFHRGVPGNIAEATNYGISRARGEYIAILDDDDYWATPDKLQRQVAFLDENGKYVACGGGAIVVDRNNVETLRYLKPENDREIKSRALLANPMVHSTLLYRRPVALALGGYNRTLAGFQDWDFVLKLGQAGKLYNFPTYFCYYSLWHAGGSFQQQTKNTRAGIGIVWSHKRRYAHAALALGLVWLYHAYAHLPLFARKHSYDFLARLKKSGFASKSSPVPVSDRS
jgi:glycosyltransferase involved in cell wall biosynthesis